MSNNTKLSPADIAVRSHDITVCLERTSVSDFDELPKLGMAVRLALHLRGVQAVSYSVVRDVAVYLLDFPAVAVKPVLELLAEAEFIRLHSEGKTIKTVIPDVPYYENLFTDLGKLSSQGAFSEPETLALNLAHRLAGAPMLIDHAYNLGASKSLVDRVVDIGNQSSFILTKRARGRSILISPTYFPENTQAYSDLVAVGGSERVRKLLDLLRQNQGWPAVVRVDWSSFCNL